MQREAPQLGTALPSLGPLPVFRCLNPRDKRWEIKADSVQRKCFCNYCSLLGSDGRNLDRNLGEGNWAKTQNPGEGVKVIHEMVWPGNVGPEGGPLAKLAKQKGKLIGLGTRISMQGAG